MEKQESSLIPTKEQSVVFTQDQISQHCSRAILLIHSKKTDPEQK